MIFLTLAIKILMEEGGRDKKARRHRERLAHGRLPGARGFWQKLNSEESSRERTAVHANMAEEDCVKKGGGSVAE